MIDVRRKGATFEVAGEPVVAFAAENPVFAGTANQEIGSICSDEDVGSLTATDRVVPCAAKNRGTDRRWLLRQDNPVIPVATVYEHGCEIAPVDRVSLAVKGELPVIPSIRGSNRDGIARVCSGDDQPPVVQNPPGNF